MARREGSIYRGVVKEATSIADTSPMLLMQLLRKLKRVRGMRGRLFARLLEARLHELENRQLEEESRKKGSRK